MKIDERNTAIYENLTAMKDLALSQGRSSTPLEDQLSTIVSARESSYREILLCIVAYMQLYPDRKVSEGWNAFHPRGLYDSGPIKQFLEDQRIPHTKSGPLNISKATNLNSLWADGRASPRIAHLVLDVIDYLESNNSPESIQSIGVSLIQKMLAEASRIEKLTIKVPPSKDPDFLTSVCVQLIRLAPDSGNTPQKIAALLLESYHKSIHSGIRVTGVSDRASVTSTTGKKPGDINEERYGRILKVYEITVKKFGHNRILDSCDCIHAFNQVSDSPVHEVIVICRPQDYPKKLDPSGYTFYAGSLVYRDVVYYFWNIYEWIASMLQRMPDDGKELFTLALSTYVSNPNTSEQVKLVWRKIHHAD